MQHRSNPLLRVATVLGVLAACIAVAMPARADLTGFQAVTSPYHTVPFKGSAYVPITCPGGTTPISSGYSGSISPYRRLTTFSYFGNTSPWIPGGTGAAPDDVVTEYGLCATSAALSAHGINPSSLHYVFGNQGTISPGGTKLPWAACPSGETALSGEFVATGPGVTTWGDFPFGTNEWAVALRNNSASDQQVYVAALCAQAERAQVITQSLAPSGTIGDAFAAQQNAICPSGTVATAAGLWADQSTAEITTLRLGSVGYNGAYVYAANINTVPTGTVYALCLG
ncbi:hypothetical protein [Actinomadura rupiterrae]|uniref:hypothetical protein n=1 Tax=Actinomadura rupiterrae TaxID=559627 RepID=UPI0020A58C16|nr:hypothetical protein [Actinomadura rupiterrae]MCP2341597.1 hypothetical protein [Actinomadura rupiterrae]